MSIWRWSKEKYVAIKINAATRNSHHGAKNELAIMDHISQQNAKHQGWHFVRKLLGSFSIDNESGRHLCLVLEPLREPLWLYCRRFARGVIPPDLLKVTLQIILLGLDYLNSGYHVIHTALKPDNVMVKIEDITLLEKDAKDEYHYPLPQNVTDKRTIYLSRNNYGQFLLPTGLIQLADFGYSMPGKTQRTGCIQAEAYRAPEVILDAGYTYSADLWSLGVILWDLLEGTKLFHPVNSQSRDQYCDLAHLAQVAALLGPPPESLLSSGKRTSLFYESNGWWICHQKYCS